MKVDGLFVLGTDTEVGKTFQAAALAKRLSKSRSVGVYKPVASGGFSPSDAQVLNDAVEAHWPLERVCPQVFPLPVAPPIAAEAEGKRVDEGLLREGAMWWEGQCDFLIVEGAGGVLSPLSSSMTVLDLAEQLDLPTVLIAANRLGVVNHSLLSIEAIRARGLEVKALVLNTWGQLKDDSLGSNARLFSMFSDVTTMHSLDELAADL